MTRRRIALSILLVLCAAVFVSGTLLILHPAHDCPQAVCPVCMALARRTEMECCLLAALSAGGMLLLLSRVEPLPLHAENQFLTDWTPVRKKVKLLN